MDEWSGAHHATVNRKHVARLCTALATLLALLGTALLVISLWVHVMLAAVLHPSDGRVLSLMFLMVVFYAVLVMVVNTHCLRFSGSCRSRSELWLWLAAAVVALLLGLCFLSTLSSCDTSLRHHLLSSMKRGLAHYTRDPTWKHVYDVLQPARRCCGVANYSDWHHTAWVTAEHVRSDSRAMLEFTKVDGGIMLPVVPYSCCKPGAGGQCLHDLLQQKTLFQSVKDSSSGVVSSIFTEGCFAAIDADLNTAGKAATVFVSLICVFQVLLVAVMVVTHNVLKARKTSSGTSSPLISPSETSFASTVPSSNRAISTKRKKRTKGKKLT